MMMRLEDRIKYKFKNRSFLMEALTHSSFSNERNIRCNERLEFLGDAVLSVIVADYLFETFDDLSEGELTKLRSNLVCTPALCDYAQQICLGNYLFLGRGATLDNSHKNPHTLEDAFEALVAAIYLDGSMQEARRFVLRFIIPAIKEHHTSFEDYKSIFQEVIQQEPNSKAQYNVIGESGPDHDKRFEVELLLNSKVVGTGVGNSKKNAEQNAAKSALKAMNVDIDYGE